MTTTTDRNSPAGGHSAESEINPDANRGIFAFPSIAPSTVRASQVERIASDTRGQPSSLRRRLSRVASFLSPQRPASPATSISFSTPRFDNRRGAFRRMLQRNAPQPARLETAQGQRDVDVDLPDNPSSPPPAEPLAFDDDDDTAGPGANVTTAPEPRADVSGHESSFAEEESDAGSVTVSVLGAMPSGTQLTPFLRRIRKNKKAARPAESEPSADQTTADLNDCPMIYPKSLAAHEWALYTPATGTQPAKVCCKYCVEKEESIWGRDGGVPCFDWTDAKGRVHERLTKSWTNHHGTHGHKEAKKDYLKNLAAGASSSMIPSTSSAGASATRARAADDTDLSPDEVRLRANSASTIFRHMVIFLATRQMLGSMTQCENTIALLGRTIDPLCALTGPIDQSDRGR